MSVCVEMYEEAEKMRIPMKKVCHCKKKVMMSDIYMRDYGELVLVM